MLAARRAAPRDEVRRLYEYLMSAIGLGATVAGLVMVPEAATSGPSPSEGQSDRWVLPVRR